RPAVAAMAAMSLLLAFALPASFAIFAAELAGKNKLLGEEVTRAESAERDANNKAEAIARQAAEERRLSGLLKDALSDSQQQTKPPDAEARRARRSLALTTLRQAADLALADPERAREVLEDAGRLPLDEDLGFVRGMVYRMARPELVSFASGRAAPGKTYF